MHQLFEPFHLANGVTLRNRLVMAPMTTWSGSEDGHVSEDELSYYQVRSGGVGMVITATTYTLPHGKGFSGQFYAGEDSMMKSLESLAESIKSQGAKAILQVFHAGRKANPNHMPDGITRSASNVPGQRLLDNYPQAMSSEEIQDLIDSFYQVTIRAYHAGFDGIEIHGANTYLLQQFFSPHANRRVDEWGGDLERRLALPLAIVEAVIEARTSLGQPDFIIGYRFSPEENHSPGISLRETSILVDRLCGTGLDYLHVSLGDYRQVSIRSGQDHGITLKRLVEVINHRKPLIGVGGIKTFNGAKDAYSYGIDLVALGRQLLVDPKTVEKWHRGEEAFSHYEPSKRRELNIPIPLHKIIMANEGWVPMKKKE